MSKFGIMHLLKVKVKEPKEVKWKTLFATLCTFKT